MTELVRYLEAAWHKTRFPQSVIIKGQDDKVCNEILSFISKINKSYTNISVENNSDIKIIELKINKTGDTQKSITVDQIRELQNFFSLTSGITPYKFAIIKSAELMNLSAANCCLKLLEEPSVNAFIFLISTSPDSLISTIRSRCVIVSIPSIFQKEELNLEILNLACNFVNPQISLIEKLPLIEQFHNNKAKCNFIEFSEGILTVLRILLNYLVTNQYSAYVETKEFLELKRIILEKNISTLKAISLYDETKYLLINCEKDHLDIKQILLMLISYFVMAFVNE